MMKPLLQVALDTLDHNDTLALAKALMPVVDIIEIGTPCIKHNGLKIVQDINGARGVNDILILADLKTMDAGQYEADPFYQAGANICTVLGVSDEGTVIGVKRAATDHGGMAQMDMMCVEDMHEATVKAEMLGVDIIGIHTGLDAQARGMTPFADMRLIRAKETVCMVSVAGGISEQTIEATTKARPDIIVVGAAIYGAESPVLAARKLQEIMTEVSIAHAA